MDARISANTNLRRQPFRGVLTEIAREEGVTRQAVQKRAARGDPDTLARIALWVRARRNGETEPTQTATELW
ncbi:MAG TPA: hypothetical protein VHI13_00420 [Candidatus Kapabacteria bacterium]|nr:hypothetical protein [Candidatus Kapabacteria bacterium]